MEFEVLKQFVGHCLNNATIAYPKKFFHQAFGAVSYHIALNGYTAESAEFKAVYKWWEEIRVDFYKLGGC